MGLTKGGRNYPRMVLRRYFSKDGKSQTEWLFKRDLSLRFGFLDKQCMALLGIYTVEEGDEENM